MVREVLAHLADRVAVRLRVKYRAGRTVTVRLRAVQIALPVGPDGPVNLGSLSGSARWAVDLAMDRARERFGREAVGYLPAALSRSRSVPDEFRELAEREV